MTTNKLLMFHLDKSQTAVINYVNKAKIYNAFEVGFNSEKHYTYYQTALILIEYLNVNSKNKKVLDFEYNENEIVLIYKSKVNEKHRRTKTK